MAKRESGSRQRIRLEEGVYQDQWGFAVVANVGGVQREQRYPPETTRADLRSARLQLRATLDQERPHRAARGTFAADAVAWLVTKEGRPCFKAERSHLKAWADAIGAIVRRAVTPDQVNAEVARWRLRPVAARTIRHRLRVLREVYAFHGDRPPLAGVAVPALPEAFPVSVPAATIRLVAKNLKAAGLEVHLARFLVRTTTGARPCQIGRAKPEDIDWVEKLWYVRAAKGGAPAALPLNAEALQAWRLFANANAFGPFDTSNEARRLRAYGWPAGIRPYAARSTFAMDLLRNGADLGDIQGLLGHRQIETTRKYYAPMLTSRLAKWVHTRRLGLPATVTRRGPKTPKTP